MQGAAAIEDTVDRLAEDGVVEEASVADGPVDPRQGLKDHPAGADGEVADLGVALLAVRQPHGLAAGGDRRGGPPRQQAVHGWRRCRRDGVAEGIVGVSPAVEDGEDERPGRSHRVPAAATMVAKTSGLRLAPPTRPPSMSGQAKSSAALAALTLLFFLTRRPPP